MELLYHQKMWPIDAKAYKKLLLPGELFQTFPPPLRKLSRTKTRHNVISRFHHIYQQTYSSLNFFMYKLKWGKKKKTVQSFPGETTWSWFRTRWRKFRRSTKALRTGWDTGFLHLSPSVLSLSPGVCRRWHRRLWDGGKLVASQGT